MVNFPRYADNDEKPKHGLTKADLKSILNTPNATLKERKQIL